MPLYDYLGRAVRLPEAGDLRIIIVGPYSDVNDESKTIFFSMFYVYITIAFYHCISWASSLLLNLNK